MRCRPHLPAKIPEARRVPGVVMGHSVIMVKEALRPDAEYLVRAGFGVLAIDYPTIGSICWPRLGSSARPGSSPSRSSSATATGTMATSCLLRKRRSAFPQGEARPAPGGDALD
jgi:hypothetical protein